MLALRSTHFTAIAVTLTMVLGFQAIRVFTTHTVWLVGETTNRSVLSLVAFGAFLAAILAWPLVRVLGAGRARLVALWALVLAALVGQISFWPWIDFAAGFVGTMTFGWALALLVARSGRLGALGIAVALAADITIRAIFVTIDAPFAHGPAATAIVVAMAALLAFASLRLDPAQARSAPTWRAWTILGIGPALAVFLAVVGNFGQVAVDADADFRAAALALGLGAAGGVALTVRMVVAPPPLARLLTIAGALAVAVGYVLLTAHPSTALVGAVLAAAGIPLVIGACLPGEGAGTGAGPAVGYTTLSMASLMLALLVFYAFFAPAWVIPVTIAVAIAAALRAMLSSGQTQAQVSWRRGETGALAAIGAMLLIPTAIAAAVVAPSTSSPPTESSEVSVMAYNIRQGFGVEGRLDLEAVARVIEENQADVVALQEVGRGWVISGAADTLAWLSHRLDMPYAYGANAADQWGNAILTRLPLTARNYRFDVPGKDPRGVQRAELEVAGVPVVILNTHLEPGDDDESTRLEQMAQVIEVWDRTPHTILIGDLNARPETPEIRMAIEAGFQDADHTGKPTSPANNPTKRIDYVLATPDLQVEEVRRPETLASDHLPVWVRLRPS